MIWPHIETEVAGLLFKVLPGSVVSEYIDGNGRRCPRACSVHFYSIDAGLDPDLDTEDVGEHRKVKFTFLMELIF